MRAGERFNIMNKFKTRNDASSEVDTLREDMTTSNKSLIEENFPKIKFHSRAGSISRMDHTPLTESRTSRHKKI